MSEEAGGHQLPHARGCNHRATSETRGPDEPADLRVWTHDEATVRSSRERPEPASPEAHASLTTPGESAGGRDVRET